MMRYRKLSSIIFIMFVFSVLSMVPSVKAAETKTLNPIADAYVDLEHPNDNYGGSPYLQVERFLIEYEYIEDWVCNITSYIKFDLSDIPKEAVIAIIVVRRKTTKAASTPSPPQYQQVSSPSPPQAQARRHNYLTPLNMNF